MCAVFIECISLRDEKESLTDCVIDLCFRLDSDLQKRHGDADGVRAAGLRVYLPVSAR